MLQPITLPLPATARLLVEGGDSRITPDPLSGVNRYGCRATPYPELLSFASATASVISSEAYAAADAMRKQLIAELAQQAAEAVYERQLQRLRGELLDLCALQDTPAPELIFAASGTDLHHIAAQLALVGKHRALTVLMVDQEETGSGVYAAISYADPDILLTTVALRHRDGTARAQAQIDAEFRNLAQQANAAGRHVLLIQTDVSKTGMIAPSYACTAALTHALGESLEVLVDACQFRIAPHTLRACLQQGYSVALTGSKFVGGPSFSGALLIPAQRSADIRARHALSCPEAGATSASALWQARYTDPASWGLLLRWEAALCELRAFRALPEAQVSKFMQRFCNAIQTRLRDDPAYSPVSLPPLQRQGLHDIVSWDNIATIHSFHVHGPDGRRLDEASLAQLYRRLPLAATPCLLAQPVACGNGKDALRLCLSAPQVVTACRSEADSERVIAQAYTVLDQLTALTRPFTPREMPASDTDTVMRTDYSIQKRVAFR